MVFENIEKTLASGEKDKSLYYPYLKEASEWLSAYFKEKNYVYSDSDMIPLFFDDEDTRLKNVKERIEASKHNPCIAAADYVKYAANIMKSFVHKYKIGFVEKFFINDYGIFKVIIACSINSGFDDTPSSKIMFAKQIKFLKEIGLEIYDDKYEGKKLKNTGENQQILFDILSTKGGQRIKIEGYEDYIDRISFYVSSNDIKNFEEETIKFEFDVGNTLNDDEILKLNKSLLEIKSSLGYSRVCNLTEISCKVVESKFADICEIFGYDCEIRRNVNSRHEDIRNKNIKIRELEEELGASFPVEKASKTFLDLLSGVNKFSLENLGFESTDFRVDEYGIVSVKLWYSMGPESISEEKMQTIFDTIGTSKESGNFGVIDSTKNKRIFLRILRDKINSVRIVNVDSIEKLGEFCIKSVDISIHNLSDLFALCSDN